MTIEIKTMNVEPRRQTFGHIARRYGVDKAASRYDEGTLDLQATDHFHYRPLYEPEFELYDAAKTAVVMEDWYKLRDPRQYYYATYNIARANMNQSVERNFAFVEKRDLLSRMDADWSAKVRQYLLPMRHVEWGANMTMTTCCERGYGTAVTAPCIFSSADHLGMAQQISRIGLVLDGSTGDSLDEAKTQWMEAPYWQGIRKVVEDTLVERDWFQLFVAQGLCIDGFLHALVYGVFDTAGQDHGATGLSMLTEFMVDWNDEHSRWVDAVIKTAAAESDANKALIAGWATTWLDAIAAAGRPLAAHVLGESAADAAVAEARAVVEARIKKCGL